MRRTMTERALPSGGEEEANTSSPERRRSGTARGTATAGAVARTGGHAAWGAWGAMAGVRMVR